MTAGGLVIDSADAQPHPAVSTDATRIVESNST